MVRIVGIPMLLAIACAAPAMAHGRGDVPRLDDRLRFEVVGEVPVDCSLSQTERRVEIEGVADPATNRARAARASLPFSVSCNTPVTVSLVSRNGALEYDGPAPTDADFTTRIDYVARVDLPGRNNALTCSSHRMDRGGAPCVERVRDAMIEGEGSVEILTRPSDGLLLQGNYRDRVTLTISPRIGS